MLMLSHDRVPRSADRFGLNAIAGRVREYVGAARLRHELDWLTSDQIAGIARDVGVGPADLARFVKAGAHAADQLPKLMRTLGISPAVMDDEQQMRELKLVCIACRRKARCDHELASGTASENFQSYCPNAPALLRAHAAK
jgi:hypothetical protein